MAIGRGYLNRNALPFGKFAIGYWVLDIDNLLPRLQYPWRGIYVNLNSGFIFSFRLSLLYHYSLSSFRETVSWGLHLPYGSYLDCKNRHTYSQTLRLFCRKRYELSVEGFVFNLTFHYLFLRSWWGNCYCLYSYIRPGGHVFKIRTSWDKHM